MDYAAYGIHNCDLINLNDMLQNGTMLNDIMIEKPHSLRTAMTLATQIVANVSSYQFGGCTITLTHLAPFVRISKENYIKKYQSFGFDDDTVNKLTDYDLKKEIKDSVQILQYQINSFAMANNGQSPFISVNMYLGETTEYKEELAMLIEEVLKQRYEGVKDKSGVPVTVAFPKLLYVLEEDNIHEDSKYWYLTELAAKCSAKRMVPDYISEKVMKQLKLSKGETAGSGDCFPCMGCRSFLGPDVTGNGWNNKAKAKDWTPTPKYYGRFNIGVVTLNLPDVALSAKKESKKTGESLLDVFWRLMDERTELCRSVNVTRAERLEHQKASIAPILWCNGAIARLSPDEELGVLIHDGYSTASLGYCGLQEAVKVLTGGYSQFDNKEGHDLGIAIMQFMNNKCTIWNKDENIGWSIYGTPLESSTYKFAKCLKKRFGEIKDITDKDYVTNSYHHWVKDEVNAFDKLSDEAEFIALSQGGAVSYVESGNLENNIPAVLEIIKHIYNTILYAELNFASDHCQKCGFDGEILLKKNDAGTYYYQCPNCGNTDTNTLHVARRVCGYISTTIPNQGRLDDIANRFRHLDDIEAKEKE